MQRWCWRISTVTRSRTKFRRCRLCSPNSASPAPSSPSMPCTVKKTLELAAATDALMIAQVKDNQPTLHRRVEQACAARPPVDQHTTRDQNQHSRDENFHGWREDLPNLYDITNILNMEIGRDYYVIASCADYGPRLAYIIE